MAVIKAERAAVNFNIGLDERLIDAAELAARFDVTLNPFDKRIATPWSLVGRPNRCDPPFVTRPAE